MEDDLLYLKSTREALTRVHKMPDQVDNEV